MTHAHARAHTQQFAPGQRLLGKGSYGMTKLMREKATGAQYAIKYIQRGEQITDHVRREIVNQRRLRHPFVVSFKEVVVTDTHLGVVMEYVSGKEEGGGRGGERERGMNSFYEGLC